MLLSIPSRPKAASQSPKGHDMSARPHDRITGLSQAAIAAVLCTAAALASADERPHFSGPSVARVGTEQVFAGKFKPNMAVTVMVRSPSGQEAGFSAVTDSTGRLRYPLTPTQAGSYTLKVVDASGQSLVQAQLYAAP